MEGGIAVKHKAKKIIKPFVLFQDNVIENNKIKKNFRKNVFEIYNIKEHKV